MRVYVSIHVELVQMQCLQLAASPVASEESLGKERERAPEREKEKERERERE